MESFQSTTSSKNPYPHDEQANIDYSPSQCSHRYGADRVIDEHIKALTQGQEKHKKTQQNTTHKIKKPTKTKDQNTKLKYIQKLPHKH